MSPAGIVRGSAPAVARTRAELAGGLARLRAMRPDRRVPVALVPTMGALHDGQLALIAEARRRRCPHCSRSLAVKPTPILPK